MDAIRAFALKLNTFHWGNLRIRRKFIVRINSRRADSWTRALQINEAEMWNTHQRTNYAQHYRYYFRRTPETMQYFQLTLPRKLVTLQCISPVSIQLFPGFSSIVSARAYSHTLILSAFALSPNQPPKIDNRRLRRQSDVINCGIRWRIHIHGY